MTILAVVLRGLNIAACLFAASVIVAAAILLVLIP